MTKQKKILIVEDELLLSKVLKLMLEKKNFVVMQVMDAENAIKATAEFKPELIIMDIFLKKNSSGIQAAEAVRKNGFKGPIIFTTGNSAQETKVELKDLENFHLFIKPVDVDELLNCVNASF